MDFHWLVKVAAVEISLLIDTYLNYAPLSKVNVLNDDVL